jgi:adhesin transport system membrane fusion protein
VPETDLLALQRELLNAQQEHQVVLGQISTAESEILGLGNDKLVLINSSMTDTRELLLKKLSERQSFLQSKDLLENQLLRSTLVAPVNGIVNRLNNKSLGATVLPGDVVVELVPTDDGIFVEAGIAPRDIAFAQVSQEVRVSVSAYDAAEFGTLSGTVTWIASDTYLNAEGQALYRVHIRLDDSFVGADNQELPLLPGMEASVDVLTNRQSILAYLLKPVRRAFNDALKES